MTSNNMYQYLLIFSLTMALAYTHTSATAAPSIVAIQLTPGNINQLQPGGPDAIAGLGDWVLSNGTLCAAISDVDHETGFNPWGGALIDVYHCGKADDQWAFQHSLPNLDKDKPLKPVGISATSNNTMAEITVSSQGDGLLLQSRYRVSSSQPRQLVIEHNLTRSGEGEPVTMFGILMLHPHMSLTPYSLSTLDSQHSRGFNFARLDRQDNMSMLEAMIPADIQVYVGSHELGDISYGVQLQEANLVDEDGDSRRLPMFQITDPTYSFQGFLSRPPWLGGKGKLGILEFAQSQLMDIRPGETLTTRQVVFLGARADVASVTDLIYQGRLLTGTAGAGSAVVHIEDAQGLPVTSIRPQANGAFQARMPKHLNAVALFANTPWGKTPVQKVQLAPGTTSTSPIPARGQSFIKLPKSGPMRLIFKGIGNTPDPDFHDNLLDFSLDGEVFKEIQSANYLSLAGTQGDKSLVALRPGKYRVLATRGMSFNVTEIEIALEPGQTLRLDIPTPMREVGMPGWWAADFHVHSAPSFDSYISLEERLRGFVAQGSDVIIATEHNAIIDYGKALRDLELQNTLKVITGTELTGMARTSTMPFTNGHMNIFPLTAAPKQFAGGIFAHEGQRLRSIYNTARKTHGNILFQLNHPRLSDPLDVDGDNAYFDHLVNGEAYDPQQPLSDEKNLSLIEEDPVSGLRDLDFNLLEVANGNGYEAYEITRADWFSLLNQGEKIFASANSDTHGTGQLSAMPQNYVKLAGDYSESGFIAAIREGQLFGTTGPLLDVYATNVGGETTGPGQTVHTRSFNLHIKVHAASWVPVEQLTIYFNGSIYHQQSITRGDQLAIPITADTDGFVVVEVTGKADQLYATVAPGFTPFAFTNPIFIRQ
ncbi:MAG: CehA/McbA family metallohydrolase [Halioglobus sp.]